MCSWKQKSPKKLAKLGDAIDISNLKLWITDWQGWVLGNAIASKKQRVTVSRLSSGKDPSNLIPPIPKRIKAPNVSLSCLHCWKSLVGFVWVWCARELCHLVFLISNPLSNRPFYLSQESSKLKKRKTGCLFIQDINTKITGLKMKNFFKKKKTYLSISPHHQLPALITTIRMQLVLFESAPSDWSSC